MTDSLPPSAPTGRRSRCMFPSRRIAPGTRPISPPSRCPPRAPRRAPMSPPPRSRRIRLCTHLVRVLDDAGQAVGPWDPRLDADTLRKMLRDMKTVRTFDDRMYRAQRQGKTSFYMKCTGEEAIAVAAATAMNADDMHFPTYRQQGLLVARGYPLVEMMNQIYSNKRRQAQGPPAADHVFGQDARLLLDLGQPRHAISAGGRLGDGERDQGRQPHRDGLDRRRRDRRGRLPFGADLRRGLPGAGRSSPWSTTSGRSRASRASPAPSRRPSPAARSAMASPGLRVDGNDALAVYAATRWAADRARIEQGADADRIFHLSRRGPFDLGRPERLPPRGRSAGVAAGRPDRAAEGASASRSANGTTSATRRSTRNSTPPSAPRRRRPKSSASCRSRASTTSRRCSRTSIAEVPWHIAEQRDEALAEAREFLGRDPS